MSTSLFSGCIDKATSSWMGKGSETRQDGVIYLQFMSVLLQSIIKMVVLLPTNREG